MAALYSGRSTGHVVICSLQAGKGDLGRSMGKSTYQTDGYGDRTTSRKKDRYQKRYKAENNGTVDMTVL